MENAARVGQASPALRIPLAQIYSIMGVAVFLGIVRYVQMFVLGFMKKTEEGGGA